MTISHRPGKLHNNADGLSRMALPNNAENPAWDPEKKNKEIPIMGISLSELHDEFFKEIEESYLTDTNTSKLVRILSQEKTDLSLSTTLESPWRELYQEGRFSLLSGLLYYREKHTSVMVLVSDVHKQQILQVCHDEITAGHFSEDRTLERVSTMAWWHKWKLDTHEYVKTSYNSSIHSTTSKAPFILERGYCPRLPKDRLKTRDIEIHPTALSFASMLNKARDHAAQCVKDSIEYNKSRWDKTHKEPNFKELPHKPVPIIETPTEKKFLKILKEKRVRENNQDITLYLVRYKNQGSDGDEWLPAEKVPNSKITLRAYRASKRGNTP
ncbi:hypothetical protein CROQUDRAFT_55280 [Cronartium quercuum f. sp. fusiforme G11]|uniref:Integrase zinc-binding domain-containing protein n=1 Tax=Cronartium quercuum f. sp. fusiforme G11 TaxID=708437 RepID=A0A9P6T500_9BASI|nr:hypothetical protein CROQUDRAFT_55280 [Cronartium quercuum f. sp. fusiforme G11]